MVIKIIFMFIVALFNIVLVIIIRKKNKTKTNAINYFSLFCLMVFLWSISIAFTFITNNIPTFSFLTKLSYIFGAGVCITFLGFSFEYPYKINKPSKWLILLVSLLSIFILYLIIFNKLFSNIQYFSFGLHELENQNILLIYGIYLIFLLTCSYYILIKKYILAVGVNKTRLITVIICTFIAFIFGMIFDWYVIYIGKYNLDRTGPFFAVIMNLSIAYLLFKKE